MSCRRKLFGKKSKRKSTGHKSDAIFVKYRNDVKVQVTEGREQHVETVNEADNTENTNEINTSVKTLPDSDETKHSECVEDFYDKIDTELETTIPKPVAKIYYTPEILYTKNYDHLTGFVYEQRNKDAYDVLMRDRCFPELLKRSKSDLDLRENNNYLTNSDTPSTDTTSRPTVTSAENTTFIRRHDSNRVAIKLDPPSRNVVNKSLTICGQRNVTRQSQYIRTRAGRPILPLEPRMKRITIAESYIRAANSTNNKVNRTESQVSRSNVKALRAQFDEKSSAARVGTMPRKQISRAPLSLAPKSSRNSAETKSELAESHLFNAMKSKVDSKGRADNDCRI